MAPTELITSNPAFKGLLPPSFLYACSSASHQIEGAIDADGKGWNVWDELLKDKKGDNGEDACGSYEHWKEDVELLKQYGCNTYRFSISWARIIPSGLKGDKVNEAGIKYYSDLVDALLAAGIQPCITIFHWDHPWQLEQECDFFNPQIVEHFVAFSDVLFERLGDRCKHWITINEPHIFTMLNSITLHKDTWKHIDDNCRMAKNLLLCHAKTVELYRNKYQPKQAGEIGITLNCDWSEPLDDSTEAKEMAEMTLGAVMGLYADPVYIGEYSDALKKEYGDRLPKFTPEEAKLIKGSSDFFGLNHYGTSYSTGRRCPPDAAPIALAFGATERVFEKDGKVIGVKGENGHPYTVPWGFRKLLNYISERYTKANGLSIYITENGFAVEGEADLPFEQQINDPLRQEYYAQYLDAMFKAIKEDGVAIGGYMAWSLLDNLEWVMGYRPRFGVTAVDRKNGFKRTPKRSAFVLRDIFSYALQKA